MKRSWTALPFALVLTAAIVVVGRELIPVATAVSAAGKPRWGTHSPTRDDVLRVQAKNLQAARAALGREPEDGRRALKVAHLELHRAQMLAVIAHETLERHGAGAPTDAPDAYARWQWAFLSTDPGGHMSRALAAAREAARGPLPDRSRRGALLLLAAIHRGRGEARCELAVLEAAARREPDVPELWVRLATAYIRAGRDCQADAAIRRLRDLTGAAEEHSESDGNRHSEAVRAETGG